MRIGLSMLDNFEDRRRTFAAMELESNTVDSRKDGKPTGRVGDFEGFLGWAAGGRRSWEAERAVAADGNAFEVVASLVDSGTLGCLEVPETGLECFIGDMADFSPIIGWQRPD